jgi:hypothetical protein
MEIKAERIGDAQADIGAFPNGGLSSPALQRRLRNELLVVGWKFPISITRLNEGQKGFDRVSLPELNAKIRIECEDKSNLHGDHLR